MMKCAVLLEIVAVSLIACKATAEEAYLTSLHGWQYYKVRASGTMTSANIKSTCEAAGYIMPCPGARPGCQYMTSDCVDTGLVRCNSWPMGDISQILCGDIPPQCPAVDSIFMHYTATNGFAIGYKPITSPGSYLHGTVYSNQFALCAKDIDECIQGACLNGATCLNTLGSYSCTCRDGWTGQNCETVPNADKCFQLSEEPKAHQAAEGQCATLGGTLAGVKTVTEQEFLADQIRLGTDVSHWVGLKNGQEHFLYTDLSTMSSNLRWMSGKPEHLCALLDKNGNYDLNADFCTEQYNYVCESDVVSCKQNVCLNGGNCTSCFNGTYAYCDCAPGFVGDRCEINIDECSSDPCHNGGTCVDGVNSYTCQCVPGFTGDDCENDVDLCINNPCPPNWGCHDLGHYFICNGYGRADADLYRCESFSCPYGWSCQDRGQLSFMCGAHV
ncbi:uncharacterized protein LOC144910946 isoform X1 [Branchiostoma floridae x Branchiostoma belcheri]